MQMFITIKTLQTDRCRQDKHITKLEYNPRTVVFVVCHTIVPLSALMNRYDK